MTKRRGQDVIDKNRKYINVCKTCYPSEQAKNDSSRSSGKIRESMLEDKLE
jgi:predicted metal-binding protein